MHETSGRSRDIARKTELTLAWGTEGSNPASSTSESAGIGSVQTFSGRHITIGEDRIVEMSDEDADCMARAGWTKLAESSAAEAA